jgi:hypothetical protein
LLSARTIPLAQRNRVAHKARRTPLRVAKYLLGFFIRGGTLGSVGNSTSGFFYRMPSFNCVSHSGCYAVILMAAVTVTGVTPSLILLNHTTKPPTLQAPSCKPCLFLLFFQIRLFVQRHAATYESPRLGTSDAVSRGKSSSDMRRVEHIPLDRLPTREPFPWDKWEGFSLVALKTPYTHIISPICNSSLGHLSL